jgi:hypothetical protein
VLFVLLLGTEFVRLLLVANLTLSPLSLVMMFHDDLLIPYELARVLCMGVALQFLLQNNKKQKHVMNTQK